MSFDLLKWMQLACVAFVHVDAGSHQPGPYEMSVFSAADALADILVRYVRVSGGQTLASEVAEHVLVI